MTKKNLCLILFTAITALFLYPQSAHAATDWTFTLPHWVFRTLTFPAPTQSIVFSKLSAQPSPTTIASVQTVTTATPTPSTIPTITTSPSLTPTTSVNSDPKVEYMMNAINQYRASQGLAPVKTDPYTCSFAQTRAQEITTDFSHTGFINRVNNHTLPYPSYSEVTENIAMTSDYSQVVHLWINSPEHAANMRQDTPYVCVKYSGNYYAYEGWRP